MNYLAIALFQCYCIHLSCNLVGDPALLIKMGQMLFISYQVVFGSSMHVVVSSTTWNLKGNLPRWSSKLQATRFSKDLICDTFFRIKVSPLYFRETKRTEEFVILEVSL